YLLDISPSMNQSLGPMPRVEAVRQALAEALRQMIFRSSRGPAILKRYRVGMLSYSDDVSDLLDGFQTIDTVAKLGVPKLTTTGKRTDTALGLRWAASMIDDYIRELKAELGEISGCPAPLVCHLTDGDYRGDDPE